VHIICPDFSQGKLCNKYTQNMLTKGEYWFGEAIGKARKTARASD